MPDTHRFIIDRHEGDLAVVEVDGGSLLDFPRWLLPHAARPDDVRSSRSCGTPRRARAPGPRRRTRWRVSSGGTRAGT